MHLFIAKTIGICLILFFAFSTSAGKNLSIRKLSPEDRECNEILRLTGKFALSNRPIQELIDDGLPSQWFSTKALKNQTILDVGSGPEATFVDELRKAGITAYAVDIYMPEPSPKPYMIQASASKLPFPDNSFDIVYSSNSIFSHYYLERADSDDILRPSINEFLRVLKPGGKIRIGPFIARISDDKGIMNKVLRGLGVQSSRVWTNPDYKALTVNEVIQKNPDAEYGIEIKKAK